MSCADEGVAAMAMGCNNLRYLNLTWCIRVTDLGVMSLAKHCCKLRWLSLHGILGITDKAITSVAASCSATLNTFDVNGCRNAALSRNSFALQQLLPHVMCWHVHS